MGVDAEIVRRALTLLDEIDSILAGARNTRGGSRIWSIRRRLREPRQEMDDYLAPGVPDAAPGS